MSYVPYRPLGAVAGGSVALGLGALALLGAVVVLWPSKGGKRRKSWLSQNTQARRACQAPALRPPPKQITC